MIAIYCTIFEVAKLGINALHLCYVMIEYYVSMSICRLKIEENEGGKKLLIRNVMHS